jgi:indolepyruvate ferredoxin oxidoreductase beta subunit
MDRSPTSPPGSLSAQAPRAITIAILAMGGEGGGVLADWIVDLAEHSGYYAQTTSVPGVAQRTGSTIYYIEIFPEAAVRAAGKEPVLAMMPVPGELDIVLASELMEAGRAIQRGLVTPDRTTLIASTNRVYSMTEKTAIGDGRVDDAKIIEASTAAAKIFVQNDFARMAEEFRSVISASLFGALAGTGALPFHRAQFEEAIGRGGVGVDASLAAFGAGFKAATEPGSIKTGELPAARPKVGPRLLALAARIESKFPSASHAILVAGIERLTDYQDEAYAAEYLDLLGPIREVDAQHGPGNFALLSETGRYLALWMSYEDATRVADLKIRRTRFERVHKDVRVDSTQLLEINEFLHPRLQEITDVLPAGLGQWLLNTAWARSLIQGFTQKGRIVQTTSLGGYFELYAIAGLRRWRRKSLRFQKEIQRINEWLVHIPTLAQENYALAVEFAECPRMVKGYGDTHQRGKECFDAVMKVLPKLRLLDEAAPRLKKLREAALADDTGQKLAEALRELAA